jgi:hypothetical protein
LVEILAEPKKEPRSREASPLVKHLDLNMASKREYSRPLKPIPELENIKYRLRKQPEKTQIKKEVRAPKDVVARKVQGLDDDNAKPKGAKKSAVKIGDNDSLVNATAKKAKKRKADGDTAMKAPKKEKKSKKKRDAKTAVKNINLSKRRPSSDGRPESVNDHTSPQELYCVADESIDRIARAESDNDSRLEINEKVIHLRHLDIH